MIKPERSYKLGLMAAVSLSCFHVSGIAMAQEDAAEQPEATRTLSTITVEARKRDESLQDVPVVITAYNAEQIDQFGITNVDDLIDLTPSLVGYASASSTQNGLFALRGVFSGPLNFGSDQTVVTNIDGVQLSGGGAGLAGQVDVEQIEILKGPQVLFFGKNATGGVISYRTADPTDELFTQARVAYELNAEEAIGEFIISGPISDTLGGRLVVNYTDIEGYIDNTFPGTSDPKLPNYSEVFTRGTLKWDPTEKFSARLKVSYADRDGGHMPIFQRTNCAVERVNDACILDDQTFIPNPLGNNNISPFPNPNFEFEGIDYSHEISSTIASLELNYELAPGLDFSSLTGFYDVSRDGFNIGTPNLFISDVSPAPGFIATNDAFESRNSFYQNALSQEFRLQSSYDQPLNFLFGVFLEDGFRSQYSEFDVDPSVGTIKIGSETVSVFGELVYALTDTVEFSGGLR